MGADASKPTTPLADWSKEEVAAAVSSLGDKYATYAPQLKDNGVNGALLASLSADDLDGMFKMLNISEVFHQRLLAQEFALITKADGAKDDTALQQAPAAAVENEFAAIAARLTDGKRFGTFLSVR